MTELTEFQQKVSALLPETELRFWEPMSEHTSFKIGGGVEIMAFPKTEDELSDILKLYGLLDCKIAILGAGTNILAPDEPIRDILMICLKDCFDGMKRLDETRIRVAAGVTMARAAVFAAKAGLGGMEFAHGIPGTVGGGVYMNAGAYGGEMKDIVESVEVMDYQGNRMTIDGKDMGFSYRHSLLQEKPLIVTGTVLKLRLAPEEEIREKMKDLIGRRKASQPLEYPSAGSAFKRPVGGYAAALIDEAGLKGFRVGGAAISGKHAGFAVNLGGATAEDVKSLLKQVADKVLETSGIQLEPEVRIW